MLYSILYIIVQYIKLIVLQIWEFLSWLNSSILQILQIESWPNHVLKLER